jgi:hypothetical protein
MVHHGLGLPLNVQRPHNFGGAHVHRPNLTRKEAGSGKRGNQWS